MDFTKKKAWILGSVLFLFLLSGASAYTIDGDTVTYENQWGQLNVTPHTSTGLIYQQHNITLTPQFPSQDIHFAFIAPTTFTYSQIELYKPVWTPVGKIFGNVSVKIDCLGSYNEDWGANSSTKWWCVDENGTTITYDHPGGYHAVWNASGVRVFHNETGAIGTEYEWVDKFVDLDAQFELSGNQRFYWAKNIPVQQGKTYRARFTYATPPGSEGKFGVYMQRASDTFIESQNNGYNVYIDPWWDGAWDYKRQLTFTSTLSEDVEQTLTVFDFNETDGHITDCNNIRIVYDDGSNIQEIPRNISRNQIDEASGGYNCSIATKINISALATNTDYYMYYDDSGNTTTTSHSEMVYYYLPFNEDSEIADWSCTDCNQFEIRNGQLLQNKSTAGYTNSSAGVFFEGLRRPWVYMYGVEVHHTSPSVWAMTWSYDGAAHSPYDYNGIGVYLAGDNGKYNYQCGTSSDCWTQVTDTHTPGTDILTYVKQEMNFSSETTDFYYNISDDDWASAGTGNTTMDKFRPSLRYYRVIDSAPNRGEMFVEEYLVAEAYVHNVSLDYITTSIGAEQTAAVAPVIVDFIMNSTGSNKTTDDLYCYGNYTDEDNTTGHITFLWYKNDTLQATYNLSATNNTIYNTSLVSDNTTKNDVWNCTIFGFDEEDEGDRVGGTLTIENTPPTHDTPILNTTNGTNTYGENLTCWAINLADVDTEDTVENRTRWYRNGTAMPTLENISEVHYGNTTANETWLCEVAPFDGTDYGENKNSSEIEILEHIAVCNMTLLVEHPFYISPNSTFFVIAYPIDSDNNTIQDQSTVNLTDNTTTYTMNFSSVLGGYYLSLYSSSPEYYQFNVSAWGGDVCYEQQNYTGWVDVSENFTVAVEYYEFEEYEIQHDIKVRNYDVELNNPYIDEFAWVFFKNHDYNCTDSYKCRLTDPSVDEFLDDWFGWFENQSRLTSYFAGWADCDKCYYASKYDNGRANVSLYHAGNYSIFLVSGFIQRENEVSPPLLVKVDRILTSDIFKITHENQTLQLLVYPDELNATQSLFNRYYFIFAVLFPVLSFAMLILFTDTKITTAAGIALAILIIFTLLKIGI